MAHKPKILYPYYKESSSKSFGQMQISRGFILSVQSQNSFNSFSILCSPAVLKEENRLCRRFSVFCFTNFHLVVSGSIDDRAQIKKKCPSQIIRQKTIFLISQLLSKFFQNPPISKCPFPLSFITELTILRVAGQKPCVLCGFKGRFLFL